MNQLFDENGMLRTSFVKIPITVAKSGDRNGAKIVKEYLSQFNVGSSVSQVEFTSKKRSTCTRAVVVGCVRFLEEKKIVKINRGKSRNSPINITILRKVEVD